MFQFFAIFSFFYYRLLKIRIFLNMLASKQRSENNSSLPKRGRPPFFFVSLSPLRTLLSRPAVVDAPRHEYIPLLPTYCVSRLIALNIHL